MASKPKVTISGSNYKKILLTRAEVDTLLQISREAEKNGQNAGLAALDYLKSLGRFKKTLDSFGTPKMFTVTTSPILERSGKIVTYVSDRPLTMNIKSTTTTQTKAKPAKAPAPKPASSSSSGTRSSPPRENTRPQKSISNVLNKMNNQQESPRQGNRTYRPVADDGEESSPGSTGRGGGGRASGNYYYTIGPSGRPTRKRIRTQSQYEMPTITREKTFDQLSAEKVMSGKGVLSSMSGALGDKIKAMLMGIKQFFDPINLLSKFVPGIGKTLGAAAGRNRPEDVAFLTGVQGPPGEEPEDDDSTPSKRVRASRQGGSGGMSSSKQLSIIAKNTMALIGMSRDINVMRQNIGKLTEKIVGKSATKADMHWLKEKELEEKTAVQEKSDRKTAKKLKTDEDTSAKTSMKDKLKDKYAGVKEKSAGVTSKFGDMAKSLLALGAALFITAKALKEFATIEWSSIAKGMVTLAGLALSTKLLKDSNSAKTLLGLSASMWILSKALSNFEDIGWDTLVKAGVALLGVVVAIKALENVGLKGALVLTAMSGALWAFSSSLKTFAEIDWKSVIYGGVALAGLAVAFGVIGGFAGPIALGAAAISLLSGALYLFGKALTTLAEPMNMFIDGLQRLSELDAGNLLKVAGSMVALGGAMIAFGAAQMVTALENLVTNFLSLGQDSPVEQLEKIGKAGPGIEKAATGMERLADAMSKFADVNVDSLTKVLKALDNFPWLKATMYALAGGSFTVTTKDGSISGGKGVAQAADAPSSTPTAVPPGTKEVVKETAKRTSSSKASPDTFSPDYVKDPKFQKILKEEMQFADPNDPTSIQAAKEAAAMRYDSSSAKPISQPSPLSSRMNESVKENVALAGQEKQQAPMMINAPTTTVVNNKGGGNAMVSGGSIRNDESVLARVQYQNVRPV